MHSTSIGRKSTSASYALMLPYSALSISTSKEDYKCKGYPAQARALAKNEYGRAMHASQIEACCKNHLHGNIRNPEMRVCLWKWDCRRMRILKRMDSRNISLMWAWVGECKKTSRNAIWMEGNLSDTIHGFLHQTTLSPRPFTCHYAR